MCARVHRALQECVLCCLLAGLTATGGRRLRIGTRDLDEIRSRSLLRLPLPLPLPLPLLLPLPLPPPPRRAFAADVGTVPERCRPRLLLLPALALPVLPDAFRSAARRRAKSTARFVARARALDSSSMSKEGRRRCNAVRSSSARC